MIEVTLDLWPQSSLQIEIYFFSANELTQICVNNGGKRHSKIACGFLRLFFHLFIGLNINGCFRHVPIVYMTGICQSRHSDYTESVSSKLCYQSRLL